MTSNHIYQHFRKDEYHFIDRLLDLVKQVEESYVFTLTEFLDPRQIDIAKSIIGQYDLQLFVSSDYIASEYARLIIAPSYYQLDENDFQIGLLEIVYNHKFYSLKHSQILGAILQQSGLKRQLIGDVLVADHQAQIFVDKTMVSYLTATIGKIARVSVTLQEINSGQRLVETQDMEEVLVLLSSFRLDKVISEVLRLSRSKVLTLLEKERVKVNYKTSIKPSECLMIGDMVSVRGFGRFKLQSEEGMSKQGKYKLIIQKMLHNHKKKI